MVDEGLLLLHGLIWFRGESATTRLTACRTRPCHLGRDRLHQGMALIDVVDGELHALELVLARTAYAPVRGTVAPIVTESPAEPAGQVPSAGLSSAYALPTRPKNRVSKSRQSRSPQASAHGDAKPCRRPHFQIRIRSCLSSHGRLDSGSTRNPVFAAFLLARKQPIPGGCRPDDRIRSTDSRRVNATFVRD